MIFDVYYPFFSKKANKMLPGIKPYPMEWVKIKQDILSSEEVKQKVLSYRNGDPNSKVSLPSICFVGKSVSTRKNAAMIPTQLVMIDIDHCENPKEAWEKIKEKATWEWICEHVIVAHITPSGKGLHIIFTAMIGDSLKANMDSLNEFLKFDEYGDYDAVVHDFARISFAFPVEDLLFENTLLYLEIPPSFENLLTNPHFNEDEKNSKKVESDDADKASKQAHVKSSNQDKTDTPTISDTEAKEFDEADWRGVKLKTIIEAWVKFRGQPGKQEIHNYYNEMIKYFRNIMGNNKRLIFHLLPKFGHSDEECWSQIKSICKVNTLSTLPREFYFFLKDNGFYVSRNKSSIDAYLLSEKDEALYGIMPTPPPIFREFLKIAPPDFRIPLVNALMPILGTLASYVKAKYPWDDRWHTPSFFSIIYAPPSYGKGFVGRLDFLFEYLEMRDLVQNARDQVYLRAYNKKSQADKSPDMPHTSLRIIPPKNSEAEFLQKQQDNHGYHMYTFAPEMDAWAKGEKAAGGNKSDMIRMAWDNDIYGQQFKSTSTFKGRVRLYWNILITGTQNQIERYFKNVENGLVTRCSFTELENQDFVLAQSWKTLDKKAMDTIRAFMKRCDENTYEEPCTITNDDLLEVSDDEFDKKIDWQFKFKQRQVVDMTWLIPVIEEFETEQCDRASLDVDKARDAFRRRVGVRGFRLGLLCTTCYPKLTVISKKTIANFVRWWMHVDLENMLKLWGKKFTEQTTYEPGLYNSNVYGALGETFTKNDLLIILKKQDIKSPIRQIIYNWKSRGFIDKVSNDLYKKTKKNEGKGK